MPKTGSTLSPLSHSLFLTMWLASMTGNFGNMVQSVGASWLMTDLDGRADMVALVQTAVNAPVMLLALVGGAIADLYDRRTVMLSAQSMMATISILLAVMTWFGHTGPWLLIGFTFAIGVSMAFYNPSGQASVSRIVPRNEIAGAVSLNILGFNVARTLGPAVGGVIVAFGGAIAAFVFNAAACLTAAIILFFWRPPVEPQAPGPKTRILAAIIEGLRTTYNILPLRTTMLRCFTFTLTGSAIWALMPLVVRDIVGGGPQQFGLLLAALGLGAVLGAAVSHEIRRRVDSEWLVRIAGAIVGIGLIIVATGPGFPVTFAVLVLSGAAWVQALSGFSVAGQMWAPRAVVGRVMATNSTMLFGGLALGSWIWGHLAEAFGVAPTIATSGIAMCLLGLLGLVFPLAPTRDAPGE